MAETFTAEDLGKTLDKLDAQLSKGEPPPSPETTTSLLKSLLDVAKGAIDLATLGAVSRKKKKEEALAKAAKDDDDKDDDDKDDTDDDALPAWLKDKVDDGKAAGEMIYPYDRDDTGDHMMTNAGGESKGLGKNIGHMGKSVQIGDTEVIDVGDHLARSEAQQQAMGKSLASLERLHKAVLDGLVVMDRRLKTLEEGAGEQARFTGICAKGFAHLIEQREEALTQPVGTSRYAGMEKSIVLAQRQLDAEGGTPFAMRGPNSAMHKEMLTKAVQSGRITQEQMIFIKRTERLPAGLTLS